MPSIVRTATDLAQGAKHISKRLVFSYILDWIVIIVIAVLGGIFSKIHGNKHPFNLWDPSIAYPMHPDTVKITVVYIVAIIVPAVVIFAISMILVPGPTVPKGTSAALIWRRKLWEWNTGWMGLGLSLAGTFFFTEGLKDLYGKPRPDLLDRCNPDLSNIAAHLVGGLSAHLANAPPIVSHTICQQTDQSILDDGFASFPSGHSSTSWCGLLYFSLFLASKFSIAIPYLSPAKNNFSPINTAFADYHRGQPRQHARSNSVSSTFSSPGISEAPLRNRAAAPPLPALVAVAAPIGTAFFITASRWFDNRHHGFDIISGSIIGIFWAWFAFRWYHLPIRRGSGWSWGARSRDRSFWIGVGEGNWVGPEGWVGSKDVEAGFGGDGGAQNELLGVTHNGNKQYTAQNVLPQQDGTSSYQPQESFEMGTVADSQRGLTR